MKSEIIEWLFYLPFVVSFFWIFIYRWKLFNPLRGFLPSHKSMLKKTQKKKKKNINYIMWLNDNYDEYEDEIGKKYGRVTKIDKIMFAILVFYIVYVYIFIKFPWNENLRGR